MYKKLTYAYEEVKDCHILKIGWLQDQAHNLIASFCAKKLNVWYQCSELLHITLQIKTVGAAENNVGKWSFQLNSTYIQRDTFNKRWKAVSWNK